MFCLYGAESASSQLHVLFVTLWNSIYLPPVQADILDPDGTKLYLWSHGINMHSGSQMSGVCRILFLKKFTKKAPSHEKNYLKNVWILIHS